MEDFGGIIWTIVVIGFAVYSMVAQQRKKAGKGAGKPVHGEAWPAWDPEPEPRRLHMDREPEIRSETYGSQEHGDESLREGRQEMRAAQQPQVYAGRLTEDTTEPEETPRQGASRSTAEGESGQTPHPEDSEDPTADFDLRKAVIYSEILKPKFDENE